MIRYDHRERRSGVPQVLAGFGLALEPADLGCADYVLSERVAVVRKTERDLAPWVPLARFERALEDVRDAYPVVVLVLQRSPGVLPDGLRRTVLTRLARCGVAVLEAADPAESAEWVARLARQEGRPAGAVVASLGRKMRDPDRLAEDLVARLPGVSHVGARRLLEHFGSVRALSAATPAEIRTVRGFGPKRSEAVAAALAHRHAEAA